jgi:hypothetical protein
MLKEIDDYDWAEVFGEGSGGNCTPIIPNIAPGSFVSGDTFCREDVEEIAQIVEGDRDGPDWVVYGRLKDGRWFVARGGCDYTGWDCQAGNSGDVADSRESIIRMGLTKEERERFGIVLEPLPSGEGK